MARIEFGRAGEKILVRLMGVTYGAADALLFELERPDGTPLPRAEPGAHIDLHLPTGLVRQYSLLTPLATATSYVIAVKREAYGRGGSQWLHDQARVGMTFVISAPRNAFPLNERAAATLLLAGGIGITPIYAMFERLCELRREVRLIYWCRSESHALFHKQLIGRPGVTLHYRDDPGRRSRPSIADALSSASLETEIYCCGPDRMVAELEANLGELPPALIHVERFKGNAGEPPVGAFTVNLARSGIELSVRSGETILNTLIAAGIDAPYSCEQGICGACETIVKAGTPLHRDTVRSSEEHDRRQTMMICCSGSRSETLVLDL